MLWRVAARCWVEGLRAGDCGQCVAAAVTKAVDGRIGIATGPAQHRQSLPASAAKTDTGAIDVLAQLALHGVLFLC